MARNTYWSDPYYDYYYDYYGANAPTPGVNAFTILVLGIGVLALLTGAFTDLYSVGVGFIILAAAWVLGLSMRVYMVGSRPYRRRDD